MCGHGVLPLPAGCRLEFFNAKWVQYSGNSREAVADSLKGTLPRILFTVNVARTKIHNPLGFEHAHSRRQ